jgi:hypothetical protein
MVSTHTVLTISRKLRNRVSQQAFRRRQSEYIKQLEQKAKEHKPDNERIIELEKENQTLRESLIHCHTKLESLRATICTLGDGISQALDGTVSVLLSYMNLPGTPFVTLFQDQTRKPRSKSTTSNESVELIEEPSPDPFSTVSDITAEKEIPKLGLESSFDDGLPNTSTESMKLVTFELPKTPDFSFSELIHQPEPRIISPLPNIWTYQYQMGPAPYVDALGANEAIAEQLKIDWTPSNSPFSEHVSALKNILREKWDGMGRSPESYPDL